MPNMIGSMPITATINALDTARKIKEYVYRNHRILSKIILDKDPISQTNSGEIFSSPWEQSWLLHLHITLRQIGEVRLLAVRLKRR